MDKILEDEAAFYRQRTVARLIDKRRQIESLEQKEAEIKKMEEMKFRIQWKEGFKKKRSEMVSTKVDKQIMHKTLRFHPDMLSHIINMEKVGMQETRPDESLAGLVDHFEDHEVSTESGQIPSTMALQSSGIIQFPGAKPNQAIQFLQNAATFKLAVNSRLRELHAQHGKGSSDYAHCSDNNKDFNRGSRMRRSSMSATDSEGEDQRATAVGTAMIAKSQEHRAFHSYRSELQISQLVLNLLHEPQAADKKKLQHNTLSTAMGVNGVNVPPRSGTASEKSLVSQLLRSSRPIKTTGLMCRVFTNSSSRQALNAAPLERTASFSLHRSSVVANASVVSSGGSRLLQGSGMKRSGGDTAAGASSVGSGGTGSDEQSRAAGAVSLPEPAAVSNGMFCSLADALFLLGPSARSLQEQIDLRRNEIPDPNSNKSSSPAPSVPDFNTTVSPTIIFCTENSYPAEMFSLLPMYCFPSDVEVGVRATKPAQDITSPTGKRRKNSLNLLTQKVVVEANASLAKSGKKRNAVFFPSDFTLGLGMSSARDSSVPKADPGLIAAVADPALPAVNAHISARNSFVLLLGDHTYQQFGLCVQLPMTFKTDQGLLIQTSYVLCLMTKLPMFSYLLHIVDQFDTYMDGLKFSSPIPTQDINFPYVSELRPLSDFAAKLKRLLVPKFPYIISSTVSNLAVPSERRRADTVGGVSSPAAPRSTAGNGLVDTEYPALENDQDTKAVLPDVEFTYGAIAASRKLHAPFRRSAFQTYFSEMGMKFDPANKTLADLIARYDRMIADFAPNSMHRSEKEKEENYMVMLWALPVLLKHLPLDQVVLALGCAITEMRIIVKHPDLHVVSCVIMALMQLLRPLKWCMPVVMILPDSLDGMLGSPTPIIIGVPKLPDYFTLLDGYVVVDPLEHIVHLNPIDVVESHTILLPHGSKLVNALNASAETILRCTKKKRHTRYRRSMPAETESGAEALAATVTSTSTVPNTSVPLPVELDLSSYENLQLLAAIKTFTGLVSNHIQAILNTAIQMQQQSKQVSQEQRRLLIRSSGEHRKTAKPKAATNSNLLAVTASATITPSAQAQEGADAQLEPVSAQAATTVIDTPPLIDEKDTALHTAAVQALLDSPVHSTQESPSTRPTTTPEPAVPEGSSPPTDRRLSGSRELKVSPKYTTRRKAGRQSDIGPGSAHSPIDTRSSLKPTAPKRSPAMRHSLPPATTKTPSPRMQRKAHSPMLDTKAAGTGKTKENIAEKLKLNLKHVHTPVHPHSSHSTRDRKSLGGSSHLKTASKDHHSHHGKKTAEAERIHATSRTTDISPLPSAGTSTTKTWSPRAEESEEAETVTATGKIESARSEVSGDEAAVAEAKAPTEVVDGANIAGVGDNLGHFSPVPPHRLHSVSSLVLNIDSLVSPFVMPTPKATKTSAATNPVISPVFVNLPVSSPDNPSDDAHQRDSLNDETCSDITVTDAGGAHVVAEEGSGGGGNRVRTESSNDSGDKMSETMGSEYSSASSSLPSLKSNAPLLLVREIGQSGAKFMKKIHDTQMYSNYCVFVKKQSVLAAAKVVALEKAAEREGGEPGFGQGVGVAGDVGSPLSTRRSPQIWSQLNMTTVTTEELPDDEEPELQLDALHEVFSIMLSGSTVMPLSMQDGLVDQYNSRYPHRPRVMWEDISAKFSTASPLPSALPSALQAMYIKAVQRYTDLTADPARTKRDSEDSAAVLWCNGLRCQGLCDTAYCTEICLALWVERVRRLRQQAVFRNIVRKKHQAKFLLRSSSNTGSAGQDPSVNTADKLNDSAEGRAALAAAIFAPKVEVVRHHKETQSQYEQRKSLVENRKLELLRLRSPSGMKSAAAQHNKEKQRSIFGPAQGDMKKCLYARSSTADPATMAIAKHYAAKQRKLRASRVRRALRVVTPLMLRFVCLYRKYKFFNAIYLIQALIRGFYVRNHIPELVEALIARRIRRLLACIRIRRYLRQHSDQIYRRYVRAKMEEQRRRRASISIPVKMPPPIPTKTDSYRQNSLPRVQKVYSISDDILPSAGITYVGLDGEQRVGSPPKRSTQDRPTGEGESDQHPAIGAGIAGDSSKEHLNIASLELNSAKLPPNASTAMPSTAAAVNKEAKPQRLSTGTYTERVKEYLQFGKMLHRGASSQLQMQQQSKYAAHYMQKRNSKPGKTMDSVAAAAVASSTVAVEDPVETTVEHAELQAHQPAQLNTAVDAVLSLEMPLLVSERTTTVAEETRSSTELTSAQNMEDHAEQDTEQGNTLVSKRTKMDLHIATQFSVETMVDPTAAVTPLLAPIDTSGLHSETPSAAESDHASEAQGGSSEKVEEVPGTMIISPTTGIPTLMGVVYPDSDDEEREGREKAGSLAFSEMNGEAATESVSSALSLLAITVVGDSIRTTSADGLTGIHVAQSQRPLAGRFSMGGGEDDDRVSVLSSSTASTAHRKRSSVASGCGGSTTDAEVAQPVLLSILGHQQQLRTIPNVTAVGSSGEAIMESGSASAEADSALAPEKAAAVVAASDDGTVVSVSSARTHRSMNRNSTGATSASNLIFDMNAMKKMSPIGRYAQEKSYDMARLFTPRPGSALVSRTSFKSQSEDPQSSAEGAVISPLMRRSGVGGRTPRIGVLEKESIKQRRQSLALGSTSAYGRRFGSLEELSEAYEESEKGLECAQTELFDGMMLDAESYTLGGKSAGMQGATAHRRSSTGSMLAVAGDGSPGLTESFRKMPDVTDLDAALQPLFTQSCSPRLGRGAHTVSSVQSATEEAYSGSLDVENRHSDSSARSEAHQLGRLSELTSVKALQSDEAKHGFGAAGEEEEDFDEDELEFTAVDDLHEAVRVAPLKTLGCNVTDYINRQQLHTLLDMWNLLREGVEVLKHGRHGNPKFKTLLCDVNLTKLYWRSVGSKADPSLDNLPEDASYYPTLLDPSAPAAVLSKGVAPSEVSTATAPPNAHRLSAPFGTKSNADRVLYIRDIVEVREDCGTGVMQRSVAKGYVTAGRTSTISLVLEDRTLDFEIEEAVWGSLFHALQILVNFYQVMMAAPRATLSIARPPEGFFNFLTYDSTGSSHGANAKKRASSGIGSMLLHRRTSKADNSEESATCL